MHLSAIEFIRHILAECDYLLKESSQNGYDDFLVDQRLSKAICRSLEIIGEASSKIHPNFNSKYPFVPWREMNDLRNRIIHHYFGIDYDIVWDTVISEVPILREYMTIILEQEKV